MSLELVKRLEPIRPGQILEIYRWGDEYLYISTVQDVSGSDLSAAKREIIELGPIMGRLIGKEYAVSGEETMAFICDAEGEVDDWVEIAAATGPGSREAVLSELESL